MSVRLASLAKRFAARRGFHLSRVAPARMGWLRSTLDAAADGLLLDPAEACQLIALVNATAAVPGDLAEVGVFRGRSARLIAEHACGRRLYLFDRFEHGLPEPAEQDSVKFHGGDFRSSERAVREYLGGFDVRILPGDFKETCRAVTDRRFSFVHLDVDLYEATLAGLCFFYERLSPGGVILCHDADSSAGVDRALAEFFQDRPEPVLPLVAGYQAAIVKVGDHDHSVSA